MTSSSEQRIAHRKKAQHLAIGQHTMIPFNRPGIAGTEIENIYKVLKQHKLAGDGAFTKLCHEWIERRFGAPRALLTHSCTAALEMAAILFDLGPGDEVVMPSFTFVSTANAAVLRGATPVFADIDPATFNISPVAVEAALTPRTKAIFVVHYAGVPCDMDAIMALAGRHGLMVLEDAAQALDSFYKGRPAGTLGNLAAFSFHETKNVVSGEGGALVVNDHSLVSRAEIIREKGTDRSRFLRGEVDKYTWVDVGSSYLPSEIVAAFLYAQLLEADRILQDRLATWSRYHAAFEPLEAAGAVTRPVIPPYARHNGHLYSLLTASAAERDQTIARMRESGVAATFHYVPLHSSPAGRRYGRAAGDLRVTEDISARLLRLPLYLDMREDADKVIETVLRVLGR